MDLSKAFDTVSLPLLLTKLEKIGVRGTALNLLKSYLSERTQKVKINNNISDEANLTYGVPQGSILGPTLFLIYVNDLCNLNIPNCKIVSYADDTVLLVHGKNWTEARGHGEMALTVIMSWLSNNILTLNLDKTVFLTFGCKRSLPPNSFSITAHKCCLGRGICSCSNITRSSVVKYLGVLVDENLTWKNQIQVIASRLRKLTYIFRQLR